MTRKLHYLVAATDGRTLTHLTNIYAATLEEAWQQVHMWHNDTCPELPSLSVRLQPQGFQAGFTRLPGCIHDEQPRDAIHVGMQVVYAPKGMDDEQ